MAVALAGCSLGAKQALATKVADSAKAAVAANSAIGTISLTVYVIKSSTGPASLVPPLSVGPLPLAIDFAHDRAEVGANPSTPGAIATVVFAGTTMYQRKTGGGSAGGMAVLDALAKNTVASMFNGTVGILSLQPPGTGSAPLSFPGIGGSGHSASSVANLAASALKPRASTKPATPASTTTTTAPNPVLGDAAITGSSNVNLGPGSQQWFQFSFDGLPNKNVPISAGAFGINPVLLVGLLHGALAGSIRNLGPATVDGRATTGYAVNLDPSQTVSGLPNHVQNYVVKQLAANGVFTDGIVPSLVWLDHMGRPQRLRLFIPQFIDRGDADALIVTMDFTSYGTPVAIGLPGVDEVAQVQSFGQLISTVANA